MRLLLACLLCLAGLTSFYVGFFLTRIELKNQTICSNNNGKVCNFPAKYKQCILVVIDALRLDFVLPEKLDFLHPQESAAAAPVYLNKLVTLRNLIAEKPNHTFISHFDADPPTTTMQRLKGLTVGGLPTFIDIKDDVASVAISEDNILAQLQHRGKRVTFMGDDTWVKLFPKELTKQFPFDSFNVKDLDTLDTGVIKHLFPEVGRGDWDLLIAHFLGVDHAGHRYGPNHAEMTRKLIQMDDVLDLLIQKMPRDALLVVIGDHGMTEDGNHGGSSLEERSTAIFAYSPSKPFSRLVPADEYVQQVDLAATLALLMDFPIPFGNLGFFIPTLVGSSSTLDLTNKAKHNAKQILAYFNAYTREIVPEAILNEMRLLIAQQQASEDDLDLFYKLQHVCRKAVEAARLQWTQFDMRLMLVGMFMGAIGFGMFIHNARVIYLFRMRNLGSAMAWALSLFALNSNSYINAEASVAAFCLQTALVFDTPSVLTKRFVIQMIVIRLALPLGELTRNSGHETVLWHLIPTGMLLGVFCFRLKWNKIYLLQSIVCFAFYWISVLKLQHGNVLAQSMYFVLFPLAVFCSTTMREALCAGVIPLSMIIGPTGGLPVILGFIYLAETMFTTSNQVWKGVGLALIAELAFFASGHLCDFGALRITAPYVGFEEFNYYRGIVMLSLDTFAAHLIGVCLARMHGKEAMFAFVLVFASRSIVTMFFVCFARRHLMVWAIFAPKFIFDSAALLATCVFAVAVEAIVRLKQPAFARATAATTQGNEEEDKQR